MTERDMEDLIAAYPDDFFPRKKLALKGRQQSFAGVGRFDLLFEDDFQTNVLMELKARPAKYEDASQLAKYKEEMERRGERHILMWLVAPQIPGSVREFLDRIGIEYTEIHEAEFRRVAARHKAVIQSEVELAPPAAAAISGLPRIRSEIREGVSLQPQVVTGPAVTSHSKFRWRAVGRDLVLENAEEFDGNKFKMLVDAFEQAVPSRRNAALLAELRAWASNPKQAQWPHGANCSLLRWVTTSSWREAVPHAEAIWNYLFGSPAPTWYVWRTGTKSYSFDAQAWNVWYASLAPPRGGGQ